MKKVRKAVIPTGGFGMRMLPATKAVPKELLPVVDKPLIQFIMEEIAGSEIEEVILITGPEKSSIEDHFDTSKELELFLEKKERMDLLESVRRTSSPVRIVSARQPHPSGLGQAILRARDLVNDEPFAVLLPDDLIVGETPCIAQLLDVFGEYGHPVIGVQAAPQGAASQHGTIRHESFADKVHRIKDLAEGPSVASPNLAVIGRFVLPPEIFAALDGVKGGAGNGAELTNAIRQLLPNMTFLGLEYEGKHFDAGNKAGLIAANLFLGLQHPEVRQELREFIRTLDLG